MKVIIQPDGIGGASGTWQKGTATDVFTATADLNEAGQFGVSEVASAIAILDPMGSLALYSGNPTSPPPKPF